MAWVFFFFFPVQDILCRLVTFDNSFCNLSLNHFSGHIWCLQNGIFLEAEVRRFMSQAFFWAVLSNRSITHYSQHAIELLVHHEPPQLKVFFHFCEDNSKLMSIWLPFNPVRAHTHMWSFIHRHPPSPLPTPIPLALLTECFSTRSLLLLLSCHPLWHDPSPLFSSPS